MDSISTLPRTIKKGQVYRYGEVTNDFSECRLETVSSGVRLLQSCVDMVDPILNVHAGGRRHGTRRVFGWQTSGLGGGANGETEVGALLDELVVDGSEN